jgi:hypothetical protein
VGLEDATAFARDQGLSAGPSPRPTPRRRPTGFLAAVRARADRCRNPTDRPSGPWARPPPAVADRRPMPVRPPAGRQEARSGRGRWGRGAAAGDRRRAGLPGASKGHPRRRHLPGGARGVSWRGGRRSRTPRAVNHHGISRSTGFAGQRKCHWLSDCRWPAGDGARDWLVTGRPRDTVSTTQPSAPPSWRDFCCRRRGRGISPTTPRAQPSRKFSGTAPAKIGSASSAR